jgi:hypothetical protein
LAEKRSIGSFSLPKIGHFAAVFYGILQRRHVASSQSFQGHY